MSHLSKPSLKKIGKKYDKKRRVNEEFQFLIKTVQTEVKRVYVFYQHYISTYIYLYIISKYYHHQTVLTLLIKKIRNYYLKSRPLTRVTPSATFDVSTTTRKNPLLIVISHVRVQRSADKSKRKKV